MDGSGAGEDDSIGRALAALGSATRLALLRTLRTPRRLRDITLASQGGAQPTTISRQAVREQIDRLMEVGLVVGRPSQQDARSPVEYLLNHQAIFALSEEVKGLARLRPAVEPPGPTVPIHETSADTREGPRLVLVKGLDEGAVYELSPASRAQARWVIGRRRGLAVSLDFDPFVSSENAIIHLDNGVHCIHDAPESRNGTRVNLRALAPGEVRVLRHGDLIGVGRSLLLYWS